MGFINNLDKQYTDLLQDILDNGVEKKDRTGTGTISVFGRQIRHKMSDGFPLLTTKKMPFKTIVTELLWFLRGDTNIKFLVDNNCHIWDGDAAKKYIEKTYTQNWRSKSKDPEKAYQLLVDQFIENIKNSPEFAAEHGNLGPIYGKQWRSWDTHNKYDIDPTPVDQIQNLIHDIKTNPDSRRLMVNAWAVHDLPKMVLPPCHYGFQVYTRELSEDERYSLLSDNEKKGFIIATNPDIKYGEEVKYTLDTFYKHIPTKAISLMWNQRSVDTFLGLPFNIASYGLLLEIIAKEVNMVPEELIGNLGDVHLYSNHIEQAKEQIGRELATEERNEWHLVNRCGGNKRDCKTDWKDFELDQQDVPKRTREPFPLPTIKVSGSWKFLSSSPCFGDTIQHKDIELENYQSHPTIKAPLSN